jgi:hypothetical protein
VIKDQVDTVPRVVGRLGFWSAVLSTIFSVAFNVAAIVERLGVLATPWDRVGLMAPSLFLALSFVVMMVCVHAYVPEERQVWTHAGLAFAIIYAVLVSIVYFVQLTVVLPRVLEGEGESVGVLLFTSFDSFMYALDVLGYGVMSLSTLFAGWAFTGEGLERAIRRAMVANGLLAPLVPTQMFFPVLLYVSAIWMVTLPLSTVLQYIESLSLLKRLFSVASGPSTYCRDVRRSGWWAFHPFGQA